MSTTRRRMLLRRGRHDSGASAVEYALILAGVALIGIVTLFILGRTATTAFTNAQAQVTAPPAGVLPSVAGSSTSAASTTSAAPTSTSAAPTSTSAAPTSSSASPTPTTSTRPTTNVTLNGTDSDPILDLNVPGNPTNTSVSMNPDIGDVYWDGEEIIFNPSNDLRDNRTFTTTVTYQYTYNGVTYTGTINVTVRT